MKAGYILASAWLCSAFAFPALARDWLFVTTNWNSASERVLAMDPEGGQTRVLWSGGAELDAVVSPDAARLYVTYIGDNGYELAEIDTATGAILYRGETPPLIRWIFPSAPGMAVSSDGHWLYLLRTNYPAGPYEFSLLTFDTRENRFASEERAVQNCTGAHPLPVSGDGNVRVLCGGGSASQVADDGLVLRVRSFRNFALAQASVGYALYTAASDGLIQVVDLATHAITGGANSPNESRRIMPSSGTMSPDRGLWYLPVKIPDNGERETEQILVFDTQAMRTTDVITPVGPFWGLALSPDGRRLYAAQPDLKSILIVDTGTRRTIGTLAVEGRPSIVLAVTAP